MEEAPIIIPGLIHAGTSFLARRLIAAGGDMGDWLNIHNEDIRLSEIVETELMERGLNNPRDRARVLSWSREWFQPSITCVDKLRRYREYREKRADGPWGFKLPSLELIAPAIRDVFPEAKIVICVRHIDDTAFSRMRKIGTTPIVQRQAIRARVFKLTSGVYRRCVLEPQ